MRYIYFTIAASLGTGLYALFGTQDSHQSHYYMVIACEFFIVAALMLLAVVSFRFLKSLWKEAAERVADFKEEQKLRSIRRRVEQDIKEKEKEVSSAETALRNSPDYPEKQLQIENVAGMRQSLETYKVRISTLRQYDRLNEKYNEEHRDLAFINFHLMDDSSPLATFDPDTGKRYWRLDRFIGQHADGLQNVFTLKVPGEIPKSYEIGTGDKFTLDDFEREVNTYNYHRDNNTLPLMARVLVRSVGEDIALKKNQEDEKNRLQANPPNRSQAQYGLDEGSPIADSTIRELKI